MLVGIYENLKSEFKVNQRAHNRWWMVGGGSSYIGWLTNSRYSYGRATLS